MSAQKTATSSPALNPAPTANTPTPLSDAELRAVVGGFNPQPDPPKLLRPALYVLASLPSPRLTAGI